MNQNQIIMHFSTAPSPDDLISLVQDIIDTLPEAILQHCDNLAVEIEEMADEALEQELDLDDPFDLMALYRNGKEIAPGVISKVANDDDVLIIFRRPILDVWCETGEHLSIIMREVIITELGRHFDFSEDEIQTMAQEHFQGMF